MFKNYYGCLKSLSSNRSQLIINRYTRCFTISRSVLTDGVYRDLTNIRTKIPFIEALRRQQNKEHDASSSSEISESRDLSPKPMSDSFHRVVIPLAKDPWLLDSYITSSGHIRLGTLFMDLDALAGIISYKHTGDSVMTVTAAVDRITLKHSLSEICDLELSGQVTFATGRSSMEVSLSVCRVPEEGKKKEEEGDVLLTCAFTMVSLDPVTKKPVPTSPLKIGTDEERKLFEEGERNYNLKKQISKTALKKQTPNVEEANLVHAL